MRLPHSHRPLPSAGSLTMRAATFLFREASSSCMWSLTAALVATACGCRCSAWRCLGMGLTHCSGGHLAHVAVRPGSWRLCCRRRLPGHVSHRRMEPSGGRHASSPNLRPLPGASRRGKASRVARCCAQALTAWLCSCPSGTGPYGARQPLCCSLRVADGVQHMVRKRRWTVQVSRQRRETM